MSLSVPFDTCVIVSGNHFEVFPSIRSRRVDRLCDALKEAGKKEGMIVTMHEKGFDLLKKDGWKPIE